MFWLSLLKCDNDEGRVSSSANKTNIRRIARRRIFFVTWFNPWLLANARSKKRPSWNCFSYPGGWSLQIWENAVWINECAGEFPTIHEQNFEQILISLDPLLVHNETPVEHLELLEKDFLKLHAMGLKLKPKKNDLFQTQMIYLGYVLD